MSDSLPDTAEDRAFKVFTFYSYKGGVGRSMALANTAALLARSGQRVLIVDFDLEAPGLGRYFEAPLDRKLPAKGGLVDLFASFRDGRELSWSRFVIPIQLPYGDRLDLLPAGGGEADYAAVLQSLNWDDLFLSHDLGDYLCRLREEWRAKYDFVLIDSRTGMSDIGGICTILMPDALVMLFTANEQSISGTADVIRRARAAQEHLPIERARLTAIPVLSRDDRRTEYEQSERWRERIAEVMNDFFDDWVAQGVDPATVLDRLYLPQVPYWSFGERLPVIERTRELEDPSSLGAAYQRITRLLEADLRWSALEEWTAKYQYVPSAMQIQEFEAAQLRRRRFTWISIAAALLSMFSVASAAYYYSLAQKDRAEQKALLREIERRAEELKVGDPPPIIREEKPSSDNQRSVSRPKGA